VKSRSPYGLAARDLLEMESRNRKAVETEFRTIRIKTPISLFELGRFVIFTFHASFAGKNSDLSQTAIKHFSYFPLSVVTGIHHSDAFSRQEFTRSSSNFRRHTPLRSLSKRHAFVSFWFLCIHYLHSEISLVKRFRSNQVAMDAK